MIKFYDYVSFNETAATNVAPIISKYSSKHPNPLWDLPEKLRNSGHASRSQDDIITVVADTIRKDNGFFSLLIYMIEKRYILISVII